MNSPSSLKHRLRRMTNVMIAVGAITLIGDIVTFKVLQNAKNNYHHAINWINRTNDIDVNIRDLTIALQNMDSLVGSRKNKQFAKLLQTLKLIDQSITDLISVAPHEEFLPQLQNASILLEHQLAPTVNQWFQLATTNPKEAELLYSKEYIPLRTTLDDLITTTKTKALIEARKYGDRLNLLMKVAAFALGLFLIFATGLSVLLSRRLSGTIVDILANLSEQLSTSIRSVQKASRHIDSASKQVAASATEHASAIEETAASMEEMTAMVTQASTNAANSLAVARGAEQQVEKGKEIVGQMNTAMQQIQIANTKLSAILQIIEDIRNKTTIINDIVFETRLLSFNASIEAARAGIHGKGFAVVAEEVGKLASLSGKAASEIRSLLDSSVSEVNQIIGTTQEKVLTAKAVTEQCGQAFFSMAEGMRQIADAMDGITTAASQQEQGIRETNRAMMDISHVTQKNSASAERMLSQVSSLGELVQSFTGLIATLRGFIYGDRGPAQLNDHTQTEEHPTGDRDTDSHADSSSHSPPLSEEPLIRRNDSRWKNVA